MAVSHHLVNVAQMAVNDVSGRGHVWGLMLQPHGTESGDYYKQMYLVLLGGLTSLLEELSVCEDPQCELCRHVEKVHVMLSQLCYRNYLSQSYI